MTATLAEVREAIRLRLTEVDGIANAFGYVHLSPTPPCAIVGWPDQFVTGTRVGNDDAWDATIPVQLLVALGDGKAADVALGAFCDPSGPSSVQEAFDRDPNLAGVLDAGYAVVTSFSNFGVAQFAEGGVQYLSATVNIEVQST